MVEGAGLESSYSVKRVVGSNPTYSASSKTREMRSQTEPTPAERAHRDQVISRVLQHIEDGKTIKLPPFDASTENTQADFALLALGPNDFSGDVGPFRYQFEGEDDLLHIAVLRYEGGLVDVAEAQQVVSFLLPKVPPALIWLRPGTVSQHFYVGHDELMR